jgi:virginiamycin B lyase
MVYNKRLARSVVRFFFSRKKTFRQRRQRGGVLLIPGLDATFAGKGSPDWMAVTKDAVWVASSSVNHGGSSGCEDQPAGDDCDCRQAVCWLVVGFGSLWIPSCGDHTVVRVDAETGTPQATIGEGPADEEGGIAVGAGSVGHLSQHVGYLPVPYLVT